MKVYFKFKSKKNLVIAMGIALIGFTATTLSFCQSQTTNTANMPQEQPKIHQYSTDLNIPFNLVEYFTGEIIGQGFFQKRSGEIVKRFRVNLTGSWNPKDKNNVQGDGTLVLDEKFYYADGTQQTRIWTIRKNDSSYEGTAADIVGIAHGKEINSQLTWNYTMSLPVDGTNYNVKFDDVMVRMNQKTVVNRAVMSKFGFELGQVILTFDKK